MTMEHAQPLLCLLPAGYGQPASQPGTHLLAHSPIKLAVPQQARRGAEREEVGSKHSTLQAQGGSGMSRRSFMMNG